jgi:hypothetical protein
MSLRGFHILFLVLALLCSAGFWAWTLLLPELAQEANAVVMGNFSGSLALGLLVYTLWFVLVKSKTIRV